MRRLAVPTLAVVLPTLTVACGPTDAETATLVIADGKDNAMDLVSRVMPESSPELDDRALDAAMAYVAEQGVTSVHHMGGMGDLDVFGRAHEHGRLDTRIMACTPLSAWKRAWRGG